MVRRLIGLSVAVSICASFFPLPIGTVPQHGKDQSAPFPCQNRPCGCASAEQCWKQCCCFTNAEKLVWARENGVTPPQYVVDAAEAESAVLTADHDSPTARHCPHCDGASADTQQRACVHSECDHDSLISSEVCSCPAERDTAVKADRSRLCESAACCSAGPGSTAEDTETVTTDDSALLVVVAVEMLKCRGQGVYWHSLPWAVVPTTVEPPGSADKEEWEPPRSVSAASIAAAPPEPPPRVAVSVC